jgi:hypothetical protein
MNIPLINQQDYLAERFRYNDDHIHQMSRLALLKLQSLQMVRKNDMLSGFKKKEMEDFVHTTLLNLVPNSFVLSEEGFYFGDIHN